MRIDVTIAALRERYPVKSQRSARRCRRVALRTGHLRVQSSQREASLRVINFG